MFHKDIYKIEYNYFTPEIWAEQSYKFTSLSKVLLIVHISLFWMMVDEGLYLEQ